MGGSIWRLGGGRGGRRWWRSYGGAWGGGWCMRFRGGVGGWELRRWEGRGECGLGGDRGSSGDCEVEIWRVKRVLRCLWGANMIPRTIVSISIGKHTDPTLIERTSGTFPAAGSNGRGHSFGGTCALRLVGVRGGARREGGKDRVQRTVQSHQRRCMELNKTANQVASIPGLFLSYPGQGLKPRRVQAPGSLMVRTRDGIASRPRNTWPSGLRRV